jgi:glycosyltransferase involved in cell wall biosynthesis
MNWVFVDPLPWDYDVATPLVRPLGGSQSALCYLAQALARRGHTVTTLTATTHPRDVASVRCLNRNKVSAELLRREETVVVELNGPASIAKQYRPLLPRGVPLVLWTQIIPYHDNEVVMTALRDPACRMQWDQIVCVSDWHRATIHERLGVPLSHMTVLKNAVAPAFENLFTDAADLAQAKSTKLGLAYTSTPFRGLDVLLNCFPEVRRDRPACELDVYSSLQVYNIATRDDDFQALYDRCRAAEGVSYHGSLAQPELARRLRQVTLWAYPSTFEETSCIAALEAMAAGAMVVTVDLGALTETCGRFGNFVAPLQRHQSRQQFEADFSQALLAAITAVENDLDAFASHQLEQVRRINAEYTWDIRAAQWEAAGEAWLKAAAR